MSRVIVHGYDPGSFAPRSVPLTVVPEPSIGALADAVVAPIRAGETVLACYPSWAEEPVRRRVQELRNALDTTRLVHVPLAAPPLAGAVITALAGVLAARLSGAELLHTIHHLDRRMVVPAAFLGSVSRLAHGAPTLTQHARSLLPGARFVAVGAPDPEVRSLRRSEFHLPLPDRPGHFVLQVAPHDAEPDVVARVTEHLGGRFDVRRAEPTPSGPSYWGTTKLVEFALHPADPDAVVSSAASTAPDLACHWCSELVAGPTCPFCGMHLQSSPSPIASAGGPA